MFPVQAGRRRLQRAEKNSPPSGGGAKSRRTLDSPPAATAPRRCLIKQKCHKNNLKKIIKLLWVLSGAENTGGRAVTPKSAAAAAPALP